MMNTVVYLHLIYLSLKFSSKLGDIELIKWYRDAESNSVRKIITRKRTMKFI